jgi:hypothetical protein
MALAPNVALAQSSFQTALSTFRSTPPPTEPSVALTPGSALVQNPLQAAASTFRERPPPPTEPSIPLPERVAALPQNATPLPKANKPKPAVRRTTVRRRGTGQSGPVTLPPPDVLVMMVRGALASANQANFTENYSVLYQLTTPALQARLSPTKLGLAFTNLRKQNLDLSPTLVLPPQFTQAPAVTPQGALRLVGFFPTRPLQINFEIVYLPIDGIWSIDELSVSVVEVGARAQAAAPVTSGSGSALESRWPVADQPMIVRKMSGNCIEQAKTFCRNFPPLRLGEPSVFRPT